MLNLEGLLELSRIYEIQDYTSMRIKEGFNLKTPEALAIYEQKYLPSEQIKALCERAYGFELQEPIVTYIPNNIVAAFSGTNAVPVTYMPMSKTVAAVCLPELAYTVPEIPVHKIDIVPTTIYFFLEMYQRYYGRHEVLQDIPAKMLLDMVVKEAIELRAADLTISTIGKQAQVYYNVRKKKISSNRIFSQDIMADVIKFLCIKSPMDSASRKPKYVGVDLNKDYRGRVVINSKFKGYEITVRLLPNAAFNTDIRSLNLNPGTVDWLIDSFLDSEPGLRLLVGETMSGKNTTALSLLRELLKVNELKVVSIEMPVEQELPGVEQISTDTLDEYVANIQSLIRQNPDFVYITEIGDATGLSTLQATNTGKRIISTLHSNGVAETLSRLVDITGLSLDRVVQALHSVCFQKLLRDNDHDRLYPKNRYVRFTKDLKYRLYGKSLGEMMKVVEDCEEGDVWI